jgi:hypothetical protein
MIKIKFEIYEWQSVTFLVAVDVDPTVMDCDQDEQKQTRHC